MVRYAWDRQMLETWITLLLRESRSVLR